MHSTLDFKDGGELDITQYALTATGGYVRASRWSVRVSVGTILDGRLEGGGRTHDIGPGVLASAALSRQFERGAWFLNGSLSASVARTTTSEGAGAPTQTLVATDVLRIGVMAGRTFGVISPYVLGRGFAGPVSWKLDAMKVTGSDTHFFQLGAGVSVATPSGWSFVVDVSALGEQSASLGVARRL